jgi:hypothetical protein
MTLDHGIKISQVGAGVSSALDKDVIFSTEFSTLKIFDTGTDYIYTDGSGNGTLTVAHNLGFAPAFFGFHNGNYRDTFFSDTTFTNCYFPIGGFYDSFQMYSDDTNLYVTCTGLSAYTHYYVKWFILVDRAQNFTGDPSISLPNHWGFKVSKKDFDVLTAKEIDLVYSTKYKSLQYYDESFKTGSMTLPGFSSSYKDQTPTAGTYLDINHGLSFPPFFLAYYHSSLMADSDQYQEIPFTTLYGDDTEQDNIDAWADSTRVRIIFKKMANYLIGVKTTYEETITVKVYIFTENLDG